MNCKCGGTTRILETRKHELGTYRRMRCRTCTTTFTTVEYPFNFEADKYNQPVLVPRELYNVVADLIKIIQKEAKLKAWIKR